MDDIIKKISIDMLKQNGIVPEKIGLIYYGENNFILPIQLNGTIYYFKFFPNSNIDQLKSEIIFTRYLRENGINTPKYFKQRDREVFETDCNSMKVLFFATEHIDADIEPDKTPELLIDIIKNVARIHMQTKKFDKGSIKIERVTDYQKLFAYYISQNEFWKKHDLDQIIEKAIQIGDEKRDTYPIHSDLRIANIMIENGRVKSFIDFGDLRESYFEDDLGKFFQSLVGTNGINLGGIKRLITLYESETDTKVSRKKIYISMIYNLMERFYANMQSQENLEYTKRAKHILSELEAEIDGLEQSLSIDKKNDEGNIERGL